jgi:hypothetical protein
MGFSLAPNIGHSPSYVNDPEVAPIPGMARQYLPGPVPEQTYENSRKLLAEKLLLRV